MALIGILLVSGCLNTKYRYNQVEAYFESCLSNPDGYWNGDEQKCESLSEKIKERMDEEGCIEARYVESVDLIRGKDYVIYLGNETYYTNDFNLTYKQEESETEYAHTYTMNINSSLCQEDYFSLEDIHFNMWYDYRLYMPYCDGNKDIIFKICEV